MDPDELLTIREAADVLNVHPDTLRRWEKAGRLVPLRTPTGHRRYRRADIALPTSTQTADGAAASEAPGAANLSRRGRPEPQSGEAAGADRSSAPSAAQSRERPSTAEKAEAMTPVSGSPEPKVYDWSTGSFRPGTYPALHPSLSYRRAAATWYPTGALKQDPATLAVAVRTTAAASGDHAWGVMTVDRGGYMVNYEMVADWLDIDGPWRKGYISDHLSTEDIAALFDVELRTSASSASFLPAQRHISLCPVCAQAVEDHIRAHTARPDSRPRPNREAQSPRGAERLER